MRLCDFQQKEVISICDCRRLGYVADLVFDECTGCIEAVIVPGAASFAACSGTAASM